MSEKILVLKKSLGFLTRQTYDRVINLNTTRVAALLTALIPARRRSGPRLAPDRRRLFTAPWAGFIMHLMRERRLVRFNLVDLLACYTDIDHRPAEGLIHPLTPQARQEASALLPMDESLLIGLQLGSRHASRQWPPEYFARLAADLAEMERARIVLLGVNSERPRAHEFLQALKEVTGPRWPAASGRIVNLVGRTTVEALGGVLARLRLLVTTDTGTMHLAAAVGTPILALFMGPAFCHETGPYGPGHMILQVMTDGSPCSEGSPRCRTCDCRTLIRPQAAASAARHLLTRGGSPLPPAGLLGPNVRLLVTEFDDFGLICRPGLPWAMTLEDGLALAFREAGRRFMRPLYRWNENRLRRESRRFLAPSERVFHEFSRDLSELKKSPGHRMPAAFEHAGQSGAGWAPLRRMIEDWRRAGDVNAIRNLIEDLEKTTALFMEPSSFLRT